LFIVLFFVSMGTLINMGAVLTLTLPILAVIATAILGKYWGCWTGAKLSAAKGEASKVGVSMLPRGEFSGIVASEGAGLGVASQILYPVAALTTLDRIENLRSYSKPGSLTGDNEGELSQST